MREEIRQKLDAIAFDLKELADELRADPGQDAQLASRAVSQSIGFMDMELSNAYGIKLRPNKRVVVEEEPSAEEEMPVTPTRTYASRVGDPKRQPKKNSPV